VDGAAVKTPRAIVASSVSQDCSTLQALYDWIARGKARGHTMLQEKQLNFHIERYGNITHLWSGYRLYSDGKQVTRGINSIQAIKEAGGWRVTGVMGAARVGRCTAAQGISGVRNRRTIAPWPAQNSDRAPRPVATL
jgi:hypothetical protein